MTEMTAAKDRMSDTAFRMMAPAFKIADFFSPRTGKLDDFGIKEGFIVIDYGRGPGRYIPEASKLAGTSGKVYAVDIHELVIKSVRDVIKKRNLQNVETIQISDYRTPLPDNTAHIIYALDMFHGISQPDRLQGEWRRLLRPDGQLVLEDGHQLRKTTKKKIADAGFFIVYTEKKEHLICKPKKNDFSGS
ncbi:MAG: class I SAM-dependent methyltransferase [Calditrichaceae bacterium]